MKDLPTHKGRRYITQLVAEGEHSRQDFKYAISDARKIARSISSFANAKGGHLLIGVKDNGDIAGVRNEEDVYMVELAAGRYCDPPQQVEFTAFSVDTGITVIRATVSEAETRPVSVIEEGGVRRAYYRVDDENIVAHPLMVRAWQYDKPLSMACTPETRRLMELLENEPDGILPERIPLMLHISQRRADELITALAAAGIITFVCRRHSFLITLPTEN